MNHSMDTLRRFLAVTIAWTGAIFLPIAVIEMLSDPFDPAQYARWLGRALELAAFPAGIAVARSAVTAGRSWRVVLETAAAAAIVALGVSALVVWLPGVLGDGNRSVSRLAMVMQTSGHSWEALNDAGWWYYGALLSPVQSLLYAAIGFQLGIWGARAVTAALTRVLFWAVGLALVVSNFAVADTTYETIVLRTAADVRFAVLYALLLPAGLCAGLALPTLALLRGPAGLGNARGG